MLTVRSFRNSCISLNQIKEAMCVNGSFDLQFVHLIVACKKNLDRTKSQR